jgi:hypothetical protein
VTAYGAVCPCGWRIGPVGNAGRTGEQRWAQLYVDARRWLHKRRCSL